jgi:hypothetical protein
VRAPIRDRKRIILLQYNTPDHLLGCAGLWKPVKLARIRGRVTRQSHSVELGRSPLHTVSVVCFRKRRACLYILEFLCPFHMKDGWGNVGRLSCAESNSVIVTCGHKYIICPHVQNVRCVCSKKVTNSAWGKWRSVNAAAESLWRWASESAQGRIRVIHLLGILRGIPFKFFAEVARARALGISLDGPSAHSGTLKGVRTGLAGLFGIHCFFDRCHPRLEVAFLLTLAHISIRREPQM